VEVKKGDQQFFELDEENGKRVTEKMRASQNYARELRIRNFTSTLFKDWVKNGGLERCLPANP
jgi:hypothetical protein